MMNTLIIYTYPNHKSLNYALLQEAIKGCHDNPLINEIQVLDLYEEQFNPILVFHEHKRRRDMFRDPKLEKYRQQIKWADKIVLFIRYGGEDHQQCF